MDLNRFHSGKMIGCFIAGIFAALLLMRTHPFHSPVREDGTTDALRAFDWWYDQRALPNELIPQGAYSRAVSYAKFSMKKEQKSPKNGASTAGWVSLGPT